MNSIFCSDWNVFQNLTPIAGSFFFCRKPIGRTKVDVVLIGHLWPNQ